MPRTEITALPDDARVWVFAAADTLSAEAEAVLLAHTDEFLRQWRAHGTPLSCARELRDGRFLCVAVNVHAVEASGCSIDGLFRTLRGLESELGTSLVTGGQLFWRTDDVAEPNAGAVQRGSRDEFAALAARGVVRPETPVFDITVTTLGAWRQAFERSAESSWHARYLRAAPSDPRPT